MTQFATYFRLCQTRQFCEWVLPFRGAPDLTAFSLGRIRIFRSDNGVFGDIL